MAAVICSAIFSAGGGIVVAMLQYGPKRKLMTEADLTGRLSLVETRVAVIESNSAHLGRAFDELKRELHDIRSMLMELTGRSAKS